MVDNSSDRPGRILSIFGDQISEDEKRELQVALDQQAHEIAKSLLQSYLLLSLKQSYLLPSLLQSCLFLILFNQKPANVRSNKKCFEHILQQLLDIYSLDQPQENVLLDIGFFLVQLS